MKVLNLPVLLVIWSQVSSCQDEPIPLVTECELSDLTKENWIANDVDSTILGTPGFGQGNANFPNAFLKNFQPQVDLQCTDFTSPCEIPNFLSLGTSIGGPCAAFANSNPRLGFVAQAWVNMHTNLKNIHNAIAQAVDEIKGNTFIQDICNDARPQATLIPRSVLLKLAKLSLIFLPSPPVGAVSVAFRAGIKGFDKLAGQALDFAQPDVEPNHDNQPQILQSLLEQITPWVQKNAIEQNTAIFNTFHSGNDNSIRDMLLGGDHMATPPSEEEYKSFMLRNIKLYLLAQLWANNGLQVNIDVERSRESCGNFEGGNNIEGLGCTILLHPQFDFSTKVFPSVGSDPPVSRFGGVSELHFSPNTFSIVFPEIMNNAFNCHKAGGDQSRVDFEAFLSSTDANIPPCLFGIPVTEE